MKLNNPYEYLIIINTPNNLCEKLLDLLETKYKISFFDSKHYEKIIFLEKYEVNKFIINNENIWNTSYKITIIRNSYDRFIYATKQFQKIRNTSIENLISKYSKFNNSCIFPQSSFLENINKYSKFVLGYNLFSLQSDLVNDNTIKYNFIIRYENMTDSLNRLFTILDINLVPQINNEIENLDFLSSDNLVSINKIFLTDFIIFRFDLMINKTIKENNLKKKINFIVPFRDRHKELRQLYKEMKNHMSIPYHIYVINQVNRAKFNRGKLINIGYSIINDYDSCYCTHDVDLIPISPNINNLYIEQIEDHIISIFSGHKKSLGGIVMFNHDTFKKSNGFSNNYQGWGCEDRDFFFRNKALNINISRKFIKDEDEKKGLFRKYYKDIGMTLPRYKKNISKNTEYLNN